MTHDDRYATPPGFAATVQAPRPDGHAPPAAGNGETFSCWLNGDVLNLPVLGHELGLPAGTPAQRIVATAWRRWATAAAERLEGAFALAVQDGDELFLCRDPSGFKDLYFAEDGCGRVSFASDLDALRGLWPSGLRVARRALHEYLRFFDVTAPHAWYEGVRAVEPGQWWHWSARGVQSGRWPDRAAADAERLDFDAAVDALDQHLARSVRACLAGAARPAAFLSAGIDSALVCAYARCERDDVVAVTVGFDGESFDESPLAREVAAHLGLRHEVLRFDRDRYVAAFVRLARDMDQPMADPAAPATLLAFEHCAQRYDVVLDGSGVEDAIGFMPPRHMRVAVEYGALVPLPLRRAMVCAMSRVPGLAGYTPILDFEHPAETMIRWHGFNRREVEALCGEPASFANTTFYRTFERFGRREHLDRYSAVMATLPSERLIQAERLTGLRLRYPFADRATAAFLRHLPPHHRHTEQESKRVLRALLARHVPRALWDLPKRGFTFPLHAFLAGDDFALVRRHVLCGRWLDRGVLKPDVVRRYAQAYIGGDERLVFRVWALTMLGAWLDAHEDLTMPPPRA